MKPKNLILGGSIKDLFRYKVDETTKIHIVKISDGTV